MKPRRTSFGTTPMLAFQRAGVGALGAGGSVAVVAAGTPTPSPFDTGGARMPEELGAEIAQRESTLAQSQTSDSPCNEPWTVLLFDLTCDHSTSLIYADIYAEAQHALATLVAAPAPTAAADRMNFVGLVGAYGWVMTWASSLMGRCLPLEAAQSAPAFNWYDPPHGPDLAHHRPASPGGYTIPGTGLPHNAGPNSSGLGFAWSAGTHSTTADANRALSITITQLNQSRCRPGVWSGIVSDDGGTPPKYAGGSSFVTVGGSVDSRWGTTEGATRATAARAVAAQLATYTVIDFWADAFRAYLGNLTAWQAAGIPVDVDAQTSSKVSVHLEQARGGQSTADIAAMAVGAAAGIIAAINPIAGAVVAIVAALIKLSTLLPQAAGGVPCPWPFLYRTVVDSTCSASTTTGGATHVAQALAPEVAQLVQAQAQARAALLQQYKTPAATPTKLSPVVTIGGSAVGLGIIFFIIKKLRKR